MDGTATLNVYEWKNEPVVNSPQYVTREEFETVIEKFKQAIEEKTHELEQKRKESESQ